MEDASRRVKKSGVSFDKVIRTNEHIGGEIVKFAQDKKFDIIVIGSRGPSPIGEIFIGSVANYVLHRSKVPVLLVK
jgi:nucleotide-binding universal stress UspA family protein